MTSHLLTPEKDLNTEATEVTEEQQLGFTPC